MLRFKIGECIISVSLDFFALLTFMLLITDTKILLISLISSLIHESGHIITMKIYGDRICRLSFTAAGIRIDKRRVNCISYNGEILISLAGVIINFSMFLLFLLAYTLSGYTLCLNIAFVNLFIGVFNLLPFEALDGGRALRFQLMKTLSEEKTERVIIITSVISIILLISGGIYLVLSAGINLSLIIIIVYLLIILINHIMELKKI